MLDGTTDRLAAVVQRTRCLVKSCAGRLAGRPRAANLAAAGLGLAALLTGELAAHAQASLAAADWTLSLLPWLRPALAGLAALALVLAGGVTLAAPSLLARRPAAKPAAPPRISERERQLQASVDDLVQWRIRLERQAQRLAEIADASLREKGNFELEVRRRDELLTQTGHDLRTALNAVIGFSDLMVREVYGPLGHAKYADYARHVHDSGMALLQVANQVLVLTARQPPVAASAVRPEPSLDAAITQTLLGLRSRGLLPGEAPAGQPFFAAAA